MTDPATLKDCSYCDGQYEPFDLLCPFCKNETGERDIDFCKVCNKEIFGTYSELKNHKHEVKEGKID
ncbi:MAG: hypothetical protein GTO02_07920 [Candidatus Dadabacteria bacterium]|nr:hypothetical protein [Candidatus Dadabacteria bacterium]